MERRQLPVRSLGNRQLEPPLPRSQTALPELQHERMLSNQGSRDVQARSISSGSIHQPSPQRLMGLFSQNELSINTHGRAQHFPRGGFDQSAVSRNGTPQAPMGMGRADQHIVHEDHTQFEFNYTNPNTAKKQQGVLTPANLTHNQTHQIYQGNQETLVVGGHLISQTGGNRQWRQDSETMIALPSHQNHQVYPGQAQQDLQAIQVHDDQQNHHTPSQHPRQETMNDTARPTKTMTAKRGRHRSKHQSQQSAPHNRQVSPSPVPDHSQVGTFNDMLEEEDTMQLPLRTQTPVVGDKRSLVKERGNEGVAKKGRMEPPAYKEERRPMGGFNVWTTEHVNDIIRRVIKNDIMEEEMKKAAALTKPSWEPIEATVKQVVGTIENARQTIVQRISEYYDIHKATDAELHRVKEVADDKIERSLHLRKQLKTLKQSPYAENKVPTQTSRRLLTPESDA